MAALRTSTRLPVAAPVSVVAVAVTLLRVTTAITMLSPAGIVVLSVAKVAATPLPTAVDAPSR